MVSDYAVGFGVWDGWSRTHLASDGARLSARRSEGARLGCAASAPSASGSLMDTTRLSERFGA